MARNNTGDAGPKARSYSCSYCSKSFIRAEHLQRHLVSHENRKPHSCLACGSSFGRADVLLRHKKKCPQHQRLVASTQEAVNAREGHQSRGSESNSALSGNTSGPRHSSTLNDMSSTLGSTVQVMESENPLMFPPKGSIRAPSNPPNTSNIVFDTAVIPSTYLTSRVSDRNHPTLIAANLSSTTLPVSQMPDQATSSVGHELTSNSPSSQRLDISSGQSGEPASYGPSLTPSWEMSRDIYNTDFTDLNMNDLMFLEDSLLPGFPCDSVDLITPFHPTPDLVNVNHSTPVPDRLLLSCTRQVTPSLEESRTLGVRQNEKVAPKELQLSSEDISTFRRRTLDIDRQNLLPNFTFPTRIRMIRLLSAYFEYFDPHTPIVHRATFDVQGSHPALVLAMLAIGGLHVSEHDFANLAYNACCNLLYSIEGYEEEPVRAPEIGVIQSLLLCAQFGAYSDNTANFRRAERHITSANSLLREYLDGLKLQENQSKSDWASWIATETCSRLAGWLSILSGVILSFHPAAAILMYLESDIPLPCSEELWKARSSAEWVTLSALTPEGEVLGMLSMSQTISAGESFREKLSAFGLLVVAGSILAYICLRERLLPRHQEELEASFIARMEQTLASLESLWRQHPQASRVPSKTASLLLLDCLSLLGSAYYHLYLPAELRSLKTFARSRGRLSSLPHPQPQSRELTLKAVLYAAQSWFVRAKLGIAHLQKTAALQFGAHSLVAAYEGALILAWWLRRHKEPNSISSSSMPTLNSEARLQDLVNEITEELYDQKIGSPDTDQCLIPLMCYRALILPWVWNYASIMRSHLDNLHEQLSQEQTR
ncbi:uncharacterized protein A1O5_10844 [Cladophialophora psammophila CBS 110553]|uniref:C2H2-type domain-containing protein n=1 Tax=Cladophialophora psammophila CBS 110553 TaxID=1182543 RepID=W9WE45_9EURO|nr:uncharacterized protein A1O5_10844 [Cladophialophora psammophila CBS 110553]EXJ66228.1 hypothetical protein A1O5_10844 [Cladophialophora psammophila CBS 110553]